MAIEKASQLTFADRLFDLLGPFVFLRQRDMAHVVFTPAPRCCKDTADYITATSGEQLDEIIENTDATTRYLSDSAPILTISVGCK
jgi:hypothetical protein